MKRPAQRFHLLLLLLMLSLAACVVQIDPTHGQPPTTGASASAAAPTTPAPTTAGAACAGPAPVRLTLSSPIPAQFAGYYAALAQGFYAEHCLAVEILPFAAETLPTAEVAAGRAEFGTAFVPALLQARAQGADLVHIAQIFQRSGTVQLSWADAPVLTVVDMANKRIGSRETSEEYELFTALRNEGIDPEDPSVIAIMPQPSARHALLNREVDAIQGLIYSDYVQLLETVNPWTGALIAPEALVVVDFNAVGTTVLQDHLFVQGAWLAQAKNEAIAIRFLAASFAGWQFCRDAVDECRAILSRAAPTLSAHQIHRQLAAINQLIWPSPRGIGILEPARWEQTVMIAVTNGLISARPDTNAFRTDLARSALSLLQGDVTGANYTPLDVASIPDGK